MQKNYCSACSTEWNKLKKRQSCIAERKGFSESRNTDLVHVALFILIDTVLTVCYHCACLCQVPEEACVCLYVQSQKCKHLDILWFALKWTLWWKLLQLFRTILWATESSWFQFERDLERLPLYNTANGVWFVKRNLTEFCQHTHPCGSGLKKKLPFPAQEMAFLVRCYANCLQPWASKVSDVYYFLGDGYNLVIKFKFYFEL